MKEGFLRLLMHLPYVLFALMFCAFFFSMGEDKSLIRVLRWEYATNYLAFGTPLFLLLVVLSKILAETSLKYLSIATAIATTGITLVISILINATPTALSSFFLFLLIFTYLLTCTYVTSFVVKPIHLSTKG